MSDLSGGLVVVARFRDLDEAVLAQMHLGAAGIDAELLDENVVRMNWAYSNAIGGIRLAVAAEDVDSATEALANGAVVDAADSEVSVESETVDEVLPACLRCGSRDLRREPDRRLQKSSILLGILLPLALIDRFFPRWTCARCGERRR